MLIAKRSHGPREGQPRWWVATLALGSLLLWCSACSGNAVRLSLLAHLQLAISEVPPVLEPGKNFTLATTLENTGPSSVDVCITHETICLRSPNGKFSPIKLSFSFDGGCAQRVTLQPHATQRFEHDGFVFPAVEQGPSTIFARVRLQIALSQFYWPSDSYSVVAADRAVSVQAPKRRPDA